MSDYDWTRDAFGERGVRVGQETYLRVGPNKLKVTMHIPNYDGPNVTYADNHTARMAFRIYLRDRERGKQR